MISWIINQFRKGFCNHTLEWFETKVMESVLSNKDDIPLYRLRTGICSKCGHKVRIKR